MGRLPSRTDGVKKADEVEREEGRRKEERKA
jgi:hypothetical protein